MCLQIWLGALHDFILCESDRHQGNLVVTDASTGAFKFIDNDHELNNRAAIGQGFSHVKDKTCIPSSLFLPQNMESWRVRTTSQPLALVPMSGLTAEHVGDDSLDLQFPGAY